MVGEWVEESFTEVVDFQEGPGILAKDFREEGVPLVRLAGVERGTSVLVGCNYLDPATVAKRWSHFALAKGDVLLSTSASLGRIAVVGDDGVGAIAYTGIIRMRARDQRIVPQFIRYLLEAPDFQRQAEMAGAGSVIRHFGPMHLREMTVTLPPPGEQRAIEHILGTLDAKIELNRRLGETLEATARVLFKSWFVDFDPVRAKANGRDPGLPKALGALFPGTFEESAIGPVPRGWKVERFDAHIIAERGLSYKGEGLRNDFTGLPMHNLNSIVEGGGYKYQGIKYYSGDYRDKHLLRPGDMIVANTEQGFDHLLIGHAAIVPKCFGPLGLYSHHLYRVRHKPSSPFGPHYLVELFNSRRWHDWICGFSNGTTINMLPMDALAMPMLVVPPVALVKAFDAFAVALHERIEGAREQSNSLTAVRDSLLPKLMAGEIRTSAKVTGLSQ